MNRLLIPASFLAVAMPAAHSILITDSGLRCWKQEQQRAAVSFQAPAPGIITEPQASDDPSWYNNYE